MIQGDWINSGHDLWLTGNRAKSGQSRERGMTFTSTNRKGVNSGSELQKNCHKAQIYEKTNDVIRCGDKGARCQGGINVKTP